ncbi:MAG: hypothetical protein JJU33_00475 [Phycisphaerales bacterium]|nr:hypothetical protein [Phycisphaerales bacterium]
MDAQRKDPEELSVEEQIRLGLEQSIEGARGGATLRTTKFPIIGHPDHSKPSGGIGGLCLRAAPSVCFALIGFIALGVAAVGGPSSPMAEPYSHVGELVYPALLIGAVFAAPMVLAVLLFVVAVILVAGSVRERTAAFFDALSRLTPHFAAVAAALAVLATASIVYATTAPNIDWIRGEPGLTGWHAAALLPLSPLAAWGAFVAVRGRAAR